MPLFSYQARAKDGAKMQGEIDAIDVNAVAAQLKSLGVFPLNITEKKESKFDSLSSMEISFGKKEIITNEELVFLSRQLYTLTKANVPILTALTGLEESASSSGLKKVISGLRRSLDEGVDLTTAMQRQDDVFPELFIGLVRIGETTGNLPIVFGDLSEYLLKEQETTRKIKSALRYPMIVLAIIAIGMVVVSVFVLPQFTKMFESFNAELPLPTRILIGFSDFIINYWYVCLAIPIIITAAVKKYLSTESGKMKWETKQLSLPLFGDLIMKATISRFAHSLAITGRAGVPMEQALGIIGPTVGNAHIEEKIKEMRLGVERGESISLNIKRMKIFPPMVVQMISVGEDSGSLDEMVTEIADYYERELDYAVGALTAAIEPVVIIFVAGLVLVLALGIFLPMISLLGSIG